MNLLKIKYNNYILNYLVLTLKIILLMLSYTRTQKRQTMKRLHKSQAKATGTKYYKGLIQVYAGQKHMESTSDNVGRVKDEYTDSS
jgi:hypothetical protein